VKLHVVAVHGIGYTARPDFSEELRRKVLAQLRQRGVIPPPREPEDRPETEVIEWYPVLWAGEVAPLEEGLYTALYPQGESFPLPDFLLKLLGLDKPRRFAIHYIGDIFIYYSRPYRRRIRAALRRPLREIRAHHRDDIRQGRPVYFTLVGHSLGSVIAFDFLHEAVCRPGPDCRLRRRRSSYAEILPGLFLTNLLTLGSPLALFSLRQERAYHHYRSGPHPFAYLEGGAWYNFYDEEDWISFPLEPIFNRPGEAKFVDDIVVDNTPTPLGAHGGYWQNDAVAQRLAQQLEKDWQRP